MPGTTTARDSMAIYMCKPGRSAKLLWLAAQIVTELRNRHARGETHAGINVRRGEVTDMLTENVVQPLLVTTSALTLATECVRMILKVRTHPPQSNAVSIKAPFSRASLSDSSSKLGWRKAVNDDLSDNQKGHLSIMRKL